MLRSKKNICCDYRSFFNWFMITLLCIFLCFWIYVSLYFKQGIILIVTIIPFFIMIYYILEMLNKKVILTENQIIAYSLLGKEKVYNMCDVSKIIVSNHRKSNYLKIKVGMNTIKMQRYARNFFEFREEICRLYGIDDYNQLGTFAFNLNKEGALW